MAKKMKGPFVTSITGKRVPLALVDAAPDVLSLLIEGAGRVQDFGNPAFSKRQTIEDLQAWAQDAREIAERLK